MATPQDNLHYNTRKIDGYNVPFNFIISEREAGKSTYIWLNKCYKAWKEKGETTLVVRRKVVHITSTYIDDISKIINKFTDDNVKFKYTSSSLKDGITDDTRNHEHGHAVQNAVYGVLMPFIVCIPSATRYWCRRTKDPSTLPPYDSVWFERQATEWGSKYIKGY